MSAMIHRICVAASVLAVLCYTGQAQQTPTPKSEQKDVQAKAPDQANPKGASQGSDKAANVPAAGMVVSVDPATRKIRQPRPDEIRALSGSATSAADAAPQIINGPGGAVGVKLGEESMVHAVVTRKADGGLTMECVTGDKAAAARVAAGEGDKSKQQVKAK